MQVRQLYIDGNNSTIVFAGSAGVIDEQYKLQLIFDTYIADEKTSKSLQYSFDYNASTEQYENEDNEYVTFNENVMTLHYDINGTSYEATYDIFDDHIEFKSGDVPQIIVDGTTYIASNIGVLQYLKHANFVDDECKPTDKDHRCTYAKEIEAIRQNLLQHLSVIKHDLWYNYEYGLPIFQKGITKAMIDAEVALIISQCPNIENIERFDSRIINNHDYHLSFVVKTKYGKLEMIDTL